MEHLVLSMNMFLTRREHRAQQTGLFCISASLELPKTGRERKAIRGGARSRVFACSEGRAAHKYMVFMAKENTMLFDFVLCTWMIIRAEGTPYQDVCSTRLVNQNRNSPRDGSTEREQIDVLRVQK